MRGKYSSKKGARRVKREREDIKRKEGERGGKKDSWGKETRRKIIWCWAREKKCKEVGEERSEEEINQLGVGWRGK